MKQRPCEISSESFAPRTEEQRYRIYFRKGEDLNLVATTDAAGIGLALVTLDDEERPAGRHLYERGKLGILDAVEGRWVILPWDRPQREATVGKVVTIRDSA